MKRIIPALLAFGVAMALIQACVTLIYVLLILGLVINFMFRPRQTAETIVGLGLFSLMCSQPLVFGGLLVLTLVVHFIQKKGSMSKSSRHLKRKPRH